MVGGAVIVQGGGTGAGLRALAARAAGRIMPVCIGRRAGGRARSTATPRSACPAPIHMPSVWSEVKVIRIVVEIVLLEEGLELLLAGKLHPAGAVNVNIPSTGLFSMLTTL